MARLDGKVALITGATGGIGEATARAFLKEGASVMLVGRNPDKLDKLEKDLAAGDRVSTAVSDAADEDATQAAFSKAASVFGGVDIVFANAGTEGDFSPIDEMSREDFTSLIETNVTGVYLTLKYAAQSLKRRGGGSIMATASIAGLVGFAQGAHYVASKHAVIGMVKSVALELGDFNIRVNAIAPGPINNRMLNSIFDQLSPNDPDAMRQGMTADLAIKRLGTNEDIANMALFLASDESTYCTGNVYTVDGGYVTA